MDERHGERRGHAGHDLDVVRVHAHVAEHQRLLRRDDPADDALRRLQLEAGGIRIPDGVADAQIPATLVEQIHGEGVERDQPPDQLRDFLEQLVELDHRRDLAAEIEQREQDVALAQA